MLHDEEFSSRAKVDRYGRRLPKDSGRKELQRYYRIKGEVRSGSDDESDKEQDVEAALAQANAQDGLSETSSDESSLSDEDNDDTEEEEEVFGFPAEQGGEGEGVPMGEPSSRLAVVNLDWDNIRAADLLAVFSSFTPGNGRILKVAVYPSEFGKERMDREDIEGPPKDIFPRSNTKCENGAESISEVDASESDDDEDDEERIKKSILKEDHGHEFNPAKLRRYQLERLRYYYAVLTCSSVPVAQAIYDAVDGTEYLTTANFFDLRFIPDEVDFSSDKPRDVCECIPDGYRPNEFVTDALQHSKVKLTWDADDSKRKEVQKRAFTGSKGDIDENDLKAYLGSDSSDDDDRRSTVAGLTLQHAADEEGEENEGDPEPKLSKKEMERQRKRALLGLGKEARTKQKTDAGAVGDMQVTFTSLAELELLTLPDQNTSMKHFDMKEIELAEKVARKGRKKRKLSRREKAAVESVQAGDGFRMNVEDPRFGAVFERAEYAIDPSHPRFKGTEGMRKLLEEGRKRQRDSDEG
jgi:hypothetical protein